MSDATDNGTPMSDEGGEKVWTLTDSVALVDNGIVVLAASRDKRHAKVTVQALRSGLLDAAAYLGTKELPPAVTAVLAADRAGYDTMVREWLGVCIATPSSPTRIAQPQGTGLVVLSPSAYASDSVYEYRESSYRRLLAHEAVHMLEERLSPNIEAMPDWWSEGLAVYVSGQALQEDDFRQPVEAGMTAGCVPGLDAIRADRRLAYQWGWTIVRFVEASGGRDTVRRVVRECADGDVPSTVGQGESPFERQWHSWLLGSQRGVWR